jgi:hypothetical protein
MTKRILAGLAGLALTGAAFGLAPTAQACDTGENGEPTIATVPGAGSQIYGTQPGGTDAEGTLGIRGGTGYLEFSGSGPDASGHIQGSAYGTPVNGRISGSATGGIDVCLADGTVGV